MLYSFFSQCYGFYKRVSFLTLWMCGAAAGTCCRTSTNGLTKTFTTKSRLAADKTNIQEQFLLRKIIMFVFSGSMCERSGQIVSPAAEDARWRGVEETWTHKYEMAKLWRQRLSMVPPCIRVLWHHGWWTFLVRPLPHHTALLVESSWTAGGC